MATSANRGAGALSRFAHFAGITSKPKAEDEPAKTDDVEQVEDKVEDVEDDVEDLKDQVEDLEDRVEDVEDSQSGDPDEPPADKPEARAAYRKGLANGRKTERARADAIMSTTVAAANPVLAMHLAFETAVSPKSALQTMHAAQAGVPAPAAASKAAAPAPGSKLDARMDGKKPIAVGTGPAASAGPDMSTPEGVAAFVAASAAKARGQKK